MRINDQSNSAKFVKYDFDGWHILFFFFSGSTLALGMPDNGLALTGINNFTPVNLLIQSLVKQLCKLLGSTPGQQQRLYTGN
jgi:hypothetical protein